MFDKATKQGHIIHEVWTNDDGQLFVIAENPFKQNHKFEYGAYYNLENGQWSFGHYDFDNIKTARMCLFHLYGDDLSDIIYKNFDNNLSK